MPSKSAKQRRFMAAAANNPKFAKKAGIKRSVAKEFHNADKKKYAQGGLSSDGKIPVRTGSSSSGTARPRYTVPVRTSRRLQASYAEPRRFIGIRAGKYPEIAIYAASWLLASSYSSPASPYGPNAVAG